MMQGSALGFWQSVWLLLKAARRRALGRQRKQRELLQNRGALNWGGLGIVIAVLFLALMHGFAARAVTSAVEASQLAGAERKGAIVVSREFYNAVHDMLISPDPPDQADDDPLQYEFTEEARDIADDDGGDRDVIEQRLRAAVASSGTAQLVVREQIEPGLAKLAQTGFPAALLGSLMLIWWFAMMVCQGEGLELDLQHRRHPMWEWLLSHPIEPGAVFFAEMLTPLASNPTYWVAPIFTGLIYGAQQDVATGIAATFLIGIPLTVAAACLGKALEIGAMLRLPLRHRGAVVGILGWFGFASMIGLFFVCTIMPRIAGTLVSHVEPLAIFSWPLLRLFLGQDGSGNFSLLRGVLFCLALSAAIIAGSVWFSARSMRGGLSGAFASDSIARRSSRPARFGRDPLFRKEYLWFVRDRSAIVQTILIPLTVAAVQVFNLRSVAAHATESWNYLSGAAILFGTYFLWVLGPKSLTSEGAALWIALTWPRGLESMLKAKAWLWSMISTGLVMLVLSVAVWTFPHDFWKIGLVAFGWFAFARSMAEKSVTLVTVTSESGEPQKIPAGRRWAAQLGMLSFSIGTVTQQWHLAVVGIVYSWITAAAMWENLRARLPYLYDPWSEVLPPPPTLMHAMVSITVLIECAAIMTGLIAGVGGKEALGVGVGLGYAICAVGVSFGTAVYLDGRGVSPVQVWCWRDPPPEPEQREPWLARYVAADLNGLRWLAYGLGGGILLALLAKLYLLAIALIPSVGQQLEASRRQFEEMPNLATSYAVVAILFAPFAEEYLFRGLVYRALDKYWGGWKAVIGAAAFFAIYHPALAWPPVALVGAANCVLFRKSRRLAPAVLLHMAYNAGITLLT